ncbi:MAG: hypothetical protein GY807_17845 [Gammaproteobacteria bacterium]|nr:hypothetical protein [Gammaproteobacteria bacterium]
MSSETRIKQLERQRQTLIQELLNTPQMIRGSFGITYRKCGKSNCWCAQGTGHPLKRIAWTENARSRTQTIPTEDIAWIETMTHNYRRFRKNRQALRALERQINTVIDEFEANIVAVTKRQKAYLK